MVIFTLSIFPSLSDAIDTSNSGRIIDNFKDRQKELLFDTAPFWGSGANAIIEQEYALNGLESLKNRLQSIEAVYQDKKNAVTSIRLSLENTLQSLDTSIKSMEQSVIDTQGAIAQKQLKIQELQATALALRVKVREHRKVILSYLANLYSEGNLVFDDAGSVDVVKGMVLTDNDSDYTLSEITYKTLVIQLGQKFVDEYRTLVRDLYTNGLAVQEEQENLKQVKSQLELQKKNLESQKVEREKILEVTKWQESLYIQYIAAQQQAQNQIENAWKDANERYQDSFESLMSKYNCEKKTDDAPMTADCIRVKQFFANEKELAKTAFQEGTSNILDWPVTKRRLSAYFRDPSYYAVLHSHHDAIDIPMEQGSEVRSPADWYVYYVLEPTPGGYSYMAIKHRDGLVTVYGHLSEVVAKKFQFVRRGEVIAKTWGAVGTPGAGPMTSGPHLHFELWKNQEPVDPLRYMTLADMDYSELPSFYQDKFITDIVERSGITADTSKYQRKFVIKWDTETDRQKYLLNMYATKDFQNWQMWVDIGLSDKIDPSFLMCVWLAESTLGNHLKTPYNIWNVGNTDDGGTYDFASPTEGIKWMTSTLNNKYLGSYNRVSDLSRWWNTNGPIYASSSSGWHGNVIRCLSALKWRFVEDGYEFRLK